MAKTEVLHLTPTQRGELHAFLRKRNLPASVAQRMRIVLLLDEGGSYRDIEEKLGAPPSTISRWKQRYKKMVCLGWRRSIPASHRRNSRRSCAPSVGADPASATRWVHALVATQDGGGDEGQQEPDRAHLERSGSEAAPAGALHGLQRSAVRAEGGGDHRPVSESAAKRRGILRGREKRHSSLGPARPPLAAYRQGGPRSMASSITGTERCRCMPL